MPWAGAANTYYSPYQYNFGGDVVTRGDTQPGLISYDLGISTAQRNYIPSGGVDIQGSSDGTAPGYTAGRPVPPEDGAGWRRNNLTQSHCRRYNQYTPQPADDKLRFLTAIAALKAADGSLKGDRPPRQAAVRGGLGPPEPAPALRGASGSPPRGFGLRGLRSRIPAEAHHHQYERTGDVPYKPLQILGSGAFGVVEKVEAIPGKAPVQGCFARKIIKIPLSISARVLEYIRNEVDIVKRLSHRHIVGVVATYLEGRRFGIIMEPVADMNLEEYFESNRRPGDADKMYTWFGCLAAGLDYLHTQRIKHRDIKPANILVRGGEILYTDFGIARDVWDEVTTSTTGMVDGKSPMYCPPEVAAEGRRGRLSDVFSLGCVFLEMATVLMWGCGVSIEEFHDFRETDGKRAYPASLEKTLRWILRLAARFMLNIAPATEPAGGYWGNDIHGPWIYPALDPSSNQRQMGFVLEWCIGMLQPEPNDRINASLLTQLVRNATFWRAQLHHPWIGSCCRESPPIFTTTRLLERWPNTYQLGSDPQLEFDGISQSVLDYVWVSKEHGYAPYLHLAGERRPISVDEFPTLASGAEGAAWVAPSTNEKIALWNTLSFWKKMNMLMGYSNPRPPKTKPAIS